MKETEFTDIVLNNRLFLIEKTLGAKAAEYSRNGDRLSNFKYAAELLRCTPEKALWAFATKHIVSIADFIGDLEAGKCPDLTQWNEKITDIVNYMILLEALIIERSRKESV